jgi:hypothetical protein
MTVAAASRATAANAEIIRSFMGTSVPLPIVLSVELLQGSTAVPTIDYRAGQSGLGTRH